MKSFYFNLLVQERTSYTVAYNMYRKYCALASANLLFHEAYTHHIFLTNLAFELIQNIFTRQQPYIFSATSQRRGG